ncbi:MAG: hypothetical protein WBM11_18810 [Terriglobales bacterium]
MRRVLLSLTLLAIALLSHLSFGQGYILVNNDSPTGNSVTGYKVTAAGTITLFKSLDTGGIGLGQDFFTLPGVAIEANGHCLFVADPGTNDIAVFEGPNFKQVTPNFTNSQLSSSLYGIGLAVDPAGKFLYTAWSGSNNIAVLAIASDCSLSLAGSPTSLPDSVSSFTMAGGGRVLAVAYPDLSGVQAFSVSPKGVLTPLGSPLVFNQAIPACSISGCFPTGQDSTDDGQYWVWGNPNDLGASTLSATLTTAGFTNAALQNYSNTTLTYTAQAWFSPAAAKTGTGNLYLAASGLGTSFPAGILVTTFKQGTITYDNDVVNMAAYVAGGVQTIGTTGTGSPLIQIASDSSGNNILYSYTVNGTALTPTDSLPMAEGSSFVIAAYPKRR